MISLDFQYFHSLHLSLMAGSSVEGCLKHFFAAEKLEHYYRSHCWHIAAIKYLSTTNENEILCLHLQRASVNVFGELIKFQELISFPLALNMNCQPPFSFSNHLDMQPDSRRLNYIHRQMENNIFSEAVAPEEFRQATSDVLKNTNVQVSRGQQSMSKTGGCSEMNSDNSNTPVQSDDKDGLVVPEEYKQVTNDVLSNTNIEDSQGQPSVSEIGGYADITSHNTRLQSNNQIDGTCDFAPAELHMYHLVSVVQHFGRAGSGHYTIYRRARAMLKDDDPNELSESTSVQWFGISDSEVYSVSEEDVLAAEASVLFYEKISE